MTDNEKRALELVEEIRAVFKWANNESSKMPKYKESEKILEYRADVRLKVQQKIQALIDKYNLPPDTKINWRDLNDTKH